MQVWTLLFRSDTDGPGGLKGAWQCSHAYDEPLSISVCQPKESKESSIYRAPGIQSDITARLKNNFGQLRPGLSGRKNRLF